MVLKKKKLKFNKATNVQYYSDESLYLQNIATSFSVNNFYNHQIEGVVSSGQSVGYFKEIPSEKNEISWLNKDQMEEIYTKVRLFLLKLELTKFSFINTLLDL